MAQEIKSTEESLTLLSQPVKRSIREMRTLIFDLENSMKTLPDYLTADQFKTTHHFQPGVYIRELFIPKNMVLTGRIHKTQHLNILSQGKMSVWTEDGIKTLQSSHVMQSLPGIKRVGYAHEDSVWITIHANPSDERDLGKVESRLFADTFEEAYLASNRTFSDCVHFLGISVEDIRRMSENELDQIPCVIDGIEIRESSIEGLGVFATKELKKLSTIGIMRINGKRTPLGRFCNHSGECNAGVKVLKNGDIELVALKDMEAGEEILNDYYMTWMSSHEKEILCPQS